jgi:DnaA family protein
MNGQLPLGIQLPPDPGLEGFVAGPNAEVLAALQALAGDGSEPYLYLWGESGSGRTHLLLGTCRRAERLGRNSQYLDLADHARLAPELLQGLERLALVALDNLETVAGRGAWEQALFGLFNRLRDAGGRLLVASRVPAAELPLELPDLRSRLTWGPGFRLRPLDDAGRMELLQRAAAARGIPLRSAEARYILNRCPRDPHSLQALLDRLDRLSLAAQRRPSIALIRQLLESAEGG